MITTETLIDTLESPDDEEGQRISAAFRSIDGSRMYVSANEEYEAKKTSLPPMFALERFRNAVEDSKRGVLAAGVLCAFAPRNELEQVEQWVTAIAPKLRCRKDFYLELYADCLLLASEFCSAWNRSRLYLVSQ